MSAMLKKNVSNVFPTFEQHFCRDFEPRSPQSRNSVHPERRVPRNLQSGNRNNRKTALRRRTQQQGLLQRRQRRTPARGGLAQRRRAIRPAGRRVLRAAILRHRGLPGSVLESVEVHAVDSGQHQVVSFRIVLVQCKVFRDDRCVFDERRNRFVPLMITLTMTFLVLDEVMVEQKRYADTLNLILN